MRGGVVLLLLIPGVAQASVAQAYAAPALDGASFIEQVRSEVTTQSGGSELHRSILRWAQYHMTAHGDTVVVTADSLSLRQATDGISRIMDVDAVIGGRWRLTIDLAGRTTVFDRPFVPGDLADVSDVGRAMDDFFPVAPRAMAPGSAFVDALHRSWHRLADSAGRQRYRWSGDQGGDSSYVTADSVLVHAVTSVHEDGTAAWAMAGGPVGWTRHIQTTVTSNFAGRTVRALVDQQIQVRRDH